MGVAKNVKKDIGSWVKSGQAATSQGLAGVGTHMSDQMTRAGGLWNENQGWGLGELKDIYGQIGAGGGGGGVPGYQGEFDASKDWWQKVADTGWRTPEQKEAGWGFGNFKDFAQTGGWTPQQMADFRARGVSGVPEAYAGMRNELQRGRQVQGGYGPGYGTANAQLLRDRARAIGEASLGTETNLAQSIRQGKMWGSEQGAGAAKGELGQMQGGQREVDSIAQRIADMNRQAAASRAGNADRDLAMRLGIIDKVTGLSRQTGADIPYGEAATQAYGARAATDQGYAQTYAAANQKKDMWDKLDSISRLGSAVGSIIPG